MALDIQDEATRDLDRLMTARNQQSHTLVETAKRMLRESTEIDLSNMATEILHYYPEAHTLQLLFDQRPGFERRVFCGHLDKESGEKVADSYAAKEHVESMIQDYNFADRDHIVNRTINLREYAARKPSWY